MATTYRQNFDANASRETLPKVKGRTRKQKKESIQGRNARARELSRGMALSYQGGGRGGWAGLQAERRYSMGGEGGRGTKENRAYRAAVLRAARAGKSVAQANRAGYRAARRSAGMAGG